MTAAGELGGRGHPRLGRGGLGSACTWLSCAAYRASRRERTTGPVRASTSVRVVSRLGPTRPLCRGRAHACVRVTCSQGGCRGPGPRPAHEAGQRGADAALLCFRREPEPATGRRQGATRTRVPRDRRRSQLRRPQGWGGEVTAPSWASGLGGWTAISPATCVDVPLRASVPRSLPRIRTPLIGVGATPTPSFNFFLSSLSPGHPFAHSHIRRAGA